MNVVLGATGLLGREVVTCLAQAGARHAGLSSADCDLTGPDCGRNPLLRQASVIFNCAAYTDVPGAERSADAAYRLNRDAVSHLVALAADTGALVVHLSTDFVFDGTARAPYDVAASPNPVQTYGASKRAGEVVLEQSGIRWLCVRTSWLYGHGKRTFVSAIRDAALAKGTVSVVTEEVGSPTYAPDLAQALLDLVGAGATGMFHVCNAGIVSRYEFAREIIRQAGIRAEVLPAAAGSVADGVRRPAYSALDAGKTERLLGRRLRPWQDTLVDFFAREATAPKT